MGEFFCFFNVCAYVLFFVPFGDFFIILTGSFKMPARYLEVNYNEWCLFFLHLFATLFAHPEFPLTTIDGFAFAREIVI